MELWINQTTKQASYLPIGTICYDPEWRCLGLSRGEREDTHTLKFLGGWFSVK